MGNKLFEGRNHAFVPIPIKLNTKQIFTAASLKWHKVEEEEETADIGKKSLLLNIIPLALCISDQYSTSSLLWQ